MRMKYSKKELSDSTYQSKKESSPKTLEVKEFSKNGYLKGE
jgi:hypothetical protein